jgi:integrase
VEFPQICWILIVLLQIWRKMLASQKLGAQRKWATAIESRIGLREIAAMQPNTILWDQEVRGFVARRQNSDIITFSVVYRTKENVQRWQKLERFPVLTPHLARQEAIRVLRAKALGQDPAGDKMALRSGMTLAQLCDEYSARDNGKKAATITSDKSRIKMHIKPKLGRYRAASITSEQVEDFMHSLRAGSKTRVVGLLGAIFSYAVKRKLVSVSPVRGVVKPQDAKRTRRLSEAEYAQLGAAINGSAISDIVLLLAVTGFRSSEAKNLRWSECDLERNIVTLGDTKTGVSVRPLSGATIDIIKRQKPGSEYVFDYRHGKLIAELHYQWLKLKMALDITPHVLRHSFASLAADLGHADSTIAGLIGHKQQSMTSRYLHLDKTLVNAANIVAAETLRLMKA